MYGCRTPSQQRSAASWNQRSTTADGKRFNERPIDENALCVCCARIMMFVRANSACWDLGHCLSVFLIASLLYLCISRLFVGKLGVYDNIMFLSRFLSACLTVIDTLECFRSELYTRLGIGYEAVGGNIHECCHDSQSHEVTIFYHYCHCIFLVSCLDS